MLGREEGGVISGMMVVDALHAMSVSRDREWLNLVIDRSGRWRCCIESLNITRRELSGYA